jgi:hypothetical protein
MKNILIDACSWIDLLTEDKNKLLPHLEFWKNNSCINFISHEVVIEEWNKHKEKQKKRFSDSIKTKYKHTKEIGRKEKLSIPENLEPNIQNIENQINTIDELLKGSTILQTSDDIKIYCSDRTITKKAPFHNKLDSTKDAYIIFSALKYFSEQKQDFIFISSNKDEFGSPNNLEIEIHPDLIENYQDTTVRYFNDIGRAVNTLKQELSLVMLPDDNSNTSTIELKDEIIIDKSKPILDQIYDYITIRHKEIAFFPIQSFINHYPFKLNSNSYPYYSVFNLSTDNQELFELFKAVEISKENNITITNPEFYNGVKDYSVKIKKVLSGLSQNLIFNISNDKTRERIKIRFSKEKKCDCPKCNYRKLKFTDCFNSLDSYTDSKEDILESAYVNYLIGNFVFAANKQKEAVKLFQKSKFYISTFITQFNLTKLYIFIRNNYFGENSQNDLQNELKKIDLAYEANKLTIQENKKVVDYLKNSEFYSNARDKIQASTTKIIDHYYSQLNGGWSSNNEVWILINEYAKLESFLNDNYIIYDKFREFNDIFTIFLEGLFASHSIDESHHSRLENFDDWLVMQIVNYGNADTINKLYRRYKIKKLKYNKTSSSGESFIELIDNFFSNDGLRDSFLNHCEKGNRRFWEYYNSVFKNILTLVSISDFDATYYNSFTQKLIDFLETETYIDHLNIKYIQIFLRRCGEQIDANLLNRLFELGISKSFYHKSDYFEALSDASANRKIKFNISENQFSVIKNISFEKCNVCDENHSTTIIIPIWQLIENINYKQDIGVIIKNKLQKEFNFHLFYLATLFDIIELDKKLLEEAIKFSIPKNNQLSFKSAFTGVDDNRFDSVNALINLCFKFDIDICTEEFKPFKTLDIYYEWLIDMDNFDYSKFQPKWIGEYSTKYYYKKIHDNKLVKDKIDEIIKDKFDAELERDYLNIYIRKTWNRTEL